MRALIPLQRLRQAGESRRAAAGDRLAAVVDGFREHNLLTYASAIAFQMLWALIPFLLLVFALLGALHLDSVWEDSLRSDVQKQTSHAAFQVIDDTIERVLRTRGLFWVTAGAALTVWELSGAVRTVMNALNEVYRARKQRPFARRIALSLGLAVAVGLCLLGALAAVRFMPLLKDPLGGGVAVGVALFLVKWLVAVLFLGLAVWLLVRYGPATPQPVSWVSFGSVLVILAWVVTSSAFAFYLTKIASYGSVFGNLASVFVLISYLYLSSCAFLFGVQLDAVVREKVRGSAG